MKPARHMAAAREASALAAKVCGSSKVVPQLSAPAWIDGVLE